MKVFLKQFLGTLVIVFAFQGGLGHALDLYVDSTVASSGDGSLSAPFKTIQEGLNVAVAGDSVIIRGDNVGRIYNATPSFINAGVPGQPITLKALPWEKVIITHSNSIYVDKGYLVIENLIFDHLGMTLDAFIWTTSNGIIRNCEIKNGAKDGIDFRPNAKNNLVEKCIIHDFKQIPRADCHGIVTTPPFFDLRIIDCKIYDCTGDSIQTFAEHSGAYASSTSLSSNLWIQGCTFYSTLGANSENALDFKDGKFITVKDCDMYGFTANKTVVCQQSHRDLVFDGNKLHDGLSGIEFRGEPVGIIQTNITFVRNVIYNIDDYAVKFDGVVNATVLNNTIVNSSLKSFFSELAGLNSGVFRNNLTYNSGAASKSGTFTSVSISHNGWFNSSAGGFAGTSETTGTDPGFINNLNDFHLKSTSTCINKGTSTIYPHNGSSPDLGAYEFGFSPGVDGKIYVQATDSTATELNTTSGTFTISRAPLTSGSLTVQFALSGSAVNGDDYQSTASSVIIPAGASSVTIPVNPIADGISEPTEIVVLTLLPGSGYEVGNTQDQIKIWDNESPALPEVAITTLDSRAAEPGSDTATVTISRSPHTTGSLVVTYTTPGVASNGVDFVMLSGSVTIPNGASSAQIIIEPNDDLESEGKEMLWVALSQSPTYQLGSQNYVPITILDNEPAPVTVVATDPSASESGDPGRFTISCAEEVAAPLTIFYSMSGTATNGTDYTNLPGSVIIPAGSTSADVQIVPINEGVVEANETAILTLLPDPAYQLGSTTNATVSIIDAAQPRLYVWEGFDAKEPSTTSYFYFYRTSGTTASLTVNYTMSGTASNGVDYATLSGSVTIPSGQTSFQLIVSPLADDFIEGTETITLTVQDGPGFQLASEAYRQSTVNLIDDQPILIYQSKTVDDDSSGGTSGNNDGIPNAGETIGLNVVIKNTGTRLAPGVSGVLSTSDSLVTIVQNSSNFGDVAVSGTATSQNAYQISIDASTEVPHEIPFVLTMQDSAGRTWLSNWSLFVYTSSTISGKVTRLTGGSPITGAVVSFTGPTIGSTISDADGSYSFVGIDGTYTVKASATGFLDSASTLVTVPPHASNVDFQLGTPDIFVSPNSFVILASPGSTFTRSMPISNLGDQPLTFNTLNDYQASHSDQAGGPTYSWIDKDATWTSITGLGDEGTKPAINLGFPFPFYDKTHTNLTVAANGWVSFASTVPSWSYPNQHIPSTAANAPASMIAPFWADLQQSASLGGAAHYKILDPNTFVFSWENFRFYGTSLLTSFQMILKSDGTMIFQYKRVDRKNEHTIGIQDSSRTKGIEVSYNNSSFIHTNMAVRIQSKYRVPWLNVSTTSGTIAPSASQDVDLNFNTTGLANGVYQTYVGLGSNDPDEPVTDIPILMVVGSPDTNGNTIPDDWEVNYFGSAFLTGGSAAADADFDNDGITNLQEYLSKTSPIDSASRLMILSQRVVGSTFEIQWSSILDVNYKVETSPDFVTWTPTADVVGLAGTTTWSEAVAPTQRRFYRVKVPSP